MLVLLPTGAVTSTSTHTKRKITGSRISLLFNNNHLDKLNLWLILLNEDSKKEGEEQLLLETGRTLEKRIFDWYNNLYGKKWVQYDAEALQWNQFGHTTKPEDAIFGGLQDGIPKVPGYWFLEIKTTSLDKLSWKLQNNIWTLDKLKDGRPLIKEACGGIKKWYKTQDEIEIPDNYMKQVQLYAYLSGNPKCTFLIYFIEIKDYIKPLDADVSNTLIVDMPDFDLALIENEIIAPARLFWHNYIVPQTTWVLSKDELQYLFDNKLLIKA